MLRLQHVSCSLIPDVRQPRITNNCGSWVLQFRTVRYRSNWIRVKALRDETNGGGGGFAGRNWETGLEIEVPFEQRPVNEYSSLKDGPLYSWGELSPGPFFLRLGSLWLVAFTVLGVPIAAASFNPSRVKPVIKLLKQTLVGTGALLVSAVLLFIFATPVEDFLQTTFASKANQSNVTTYGSSAKSNIRKEELLRLPVEVKGDDDLAAAAAEAADGRPVYCRDRFYRALAGGQYCKWEDLLNYCKSSSRNLVGAPRIDSI